MSKSKVFLDSSFAIAITSTSDQLHADAKRLNAWICSSRPSIVTTRAVFLEVGNAFAKSPRRLQVIALLEALENDSAVQVVEVTKELYTEGLALYQARRDKQWGLVDCRSFVVMEQYGVTEALTADIHFQQAGFRALLRHD